MCYCQSAYIKDPSHLTTEEQPNAINNQLDDQSIQCSMKQSYVCCHWLTSVTHPPLVELRNKNNNTWIEATFSYLVLFLKETIFLFEIDIKVLRVIIVHKNQL